MRGQQKNAWNSYNYFILEQRDILKYGRAWVEEIKMARVELEVNFEK
jgi:hypothetical protein